MAVTLYDKIVGWLDPAWLLQFAVYYYFECAFDSLRHSPSDLFNGKLRDKAFARFWEAVSPPAAPGAKPEPMAGAFVKLPSLYASASGHVLELGPGSGAHMKYYDRGAITKIYGAEPAEGLHSALHRSAAAVGLRDKVEILACGAEPESLIPALHASGFLRSTGDKNDAKDGHFDTIVSVRSLCSVPRPQETIAALYGLLRPGGKLVICEHVVNAWPEPHGSIIGRFLQIFYTLIGWPYFVGNCQLSRNTIGMLFEAAQRADGGWASVDLWREKEWSALPWSLGTFVKKG